MLKFETSNEQPSQKESISGNELEPNFNSEFNSVTNFRTSQALKPIAEDDLEEEFSSEFAAEDQNKQNEDIPQKHACVGNFKFETEPNFSPKNIDNIYYGSGDDYFSLGNTIARHPDKIKTIMELYEEFDEELLEDILFDLDKD